jgi:hypothetical protein
MDYKFGNKNNWRNWVWNRISERVKNKRDGLILFLAGPDAKDIDVARRAGFDVRNMIAVEKDPEVISRLRSNGILTIEGDLLDVLYSWSPYRDVAVIVADFCSGLEDKVIGCFQTVMTGNPSFYKTVIVGNFLRGRDRSSNYYREYINENFTLSIPIHRGKIFFAASTVKFWSVLADRLDWSMALKINAEKVLMQSCRPDTYTYKSTAGTQRFDSVCFINPSCLIDPDEIRAEVGAIHIKYEVEPDVIDRLEKQKRKTAAVIAHHTIRKAA